MNKNLNDFGLPKKTFPDKIQEWLDKAFVWVIIIGGTVATTWGFDWLKPGNSVQGLWHSIYFVVGAAIGFVALLFLDWLLEKIRKRVFEPEDVGLAH